ncbi:ABC transporter ATP-binding protein [Halalkalicoccus jeotgali]|uniref:ABC transporter related protein n=1 Tax=Halalkalicoccus jeotgali (strain DSM 18796 / CECT 7217 / JCM 14584 / KCTC 4019 / B3) TaxID=795797 RepID=D8J9E8_HALJB|nr:ABC transporter ATP-binding protein [Halalkalicoccus jeotgali]ADJ14360.1 ABC transporter related protein [Halalkalicoccus jeotgali B3]ELY40621.1 ABC transporter-like protein [Halalkalicoccus jeotgali B3]
MIDLDGVGVDFEGVRALDGVDLRIADGEFVTVVGPSGCGKTTLLRAIGGLEVPTAGAVRIDGDPPSAAQAGARLGFVFQSHTLLPWKSATENVTFLREMAGEEPKREEARELLASIGLAGFEDAKPRELSGGMSQRVAIARAIHLGADVLLMDEPFGELDEITRDELGVEIRDLWRRERKTVVFVTHSVPEAVFLADRCVVMGVAGRIERVVEVDLPAPRDEAVLGSRAFQKQVAAVRRTLHEHHA